jgi:methionyl aminopeptidase
MNFVDAAEAPGRKTGQIKLHGAEDFAAMRKACKLTAEALDMMVDVVKPGVTTEALDKLCFEFAIDHGAYPAPLNYRGYRKSICTSINHVVCHGIPDDKPLREGDIVNIDITLVLWVLKLILFGMILSDKPETCQMSSCTRDDLSRPKHAKGFELQKLLVADG